MGVEAKIIDVTRRLSQRGVNERVATRVAGESRFTEAAFEFLSRPYDEPRAFRHLRSLGHNSRPQASGLPSGSATDHNPQEQPSPA